MKPTLALAVLLCLVLSLEAATTTAAPQPAPAEYTSVFPMCTDTGPTESGCWQSEETKEPPQSELHCQTIYQFCSAWHWGGDCCPNGRKKLFKECNSWIQCGNNPITQSTVIFYTCSTILCVQ